MDEAGSWEQSGDGACWGRWGGGGDLEGFAKPLPQPNQTSWDPSCALRAPLSQPHAHTSPLLLQCGSPAPLTPGWPHPRTVPLYLGRGAVACGVRSGWAEFERGF